MRVPKSDLTEARRRVALQRERKLRLQNDRDAGRLILADQAARDAFEAARVLRESILNVPSRVAAELAAEPDAARVEARLSGELRQALDAVAQRLADDA